jgi:hypothetical protein
MHDVLGADTLRVELGAGAPHQRVLAVVRQGPDNYTTCMDS